MSSFTMSVILCVIVILSVWSTWKNHPVAVTFDDKTTPIAEIPFPAVTICTTQKFDTKVELSSHYGFATSFHQLFDGDPSRLDAAAQTCFKYLSVEGNEYNVSIYEAINDISPNKSLVIGAATWLDGMRAANFEPIFTNEGLCFTLNSINSRDIYADEVASELLTVRDNPNAIWDVEQGYGSIENASELYPNRMMGASFSYSLQVVTNIHLKHTFTECGFPAPGFMLAVHTADEIPQLSNGYDFVSYSGYAKVLIKPTVMETLDGLRSYAPHVRNCYFRSERKLRFFKSYNQNNCEIECLANFTTNECGCVRFYMPRDENTKVCRYNDINCCIGAENKYTETSAVKMCDCQADCTSISYEMEIAQMKRVGNAEKIQTKSNEVGLQQSIFRIMFKKITFITIIRAETNTMSEFISSCGGLLGLFMGISVLSIIELFYFFTLRLCCKWRKKKSIQNAMDIEASQNNIWTLTDGNNANRSFRLQN